MSNEQKESHRQKLGAIIKQLDMAFTVYSVFPDIKGGSSSWQTRIIECHSDNHRVVELVLQRAGNLQKSLVLAS